MSAFSEDTYEQALIELFQSLEGKQYRYEYGPDIVRNYANPLLHDVLQESLLRINPELPESAIDEAIKKLLTDLWASGCCRTVAEGVLGAEFIWGENLNEIPGLTDLLKSFLCKIKNEGMRAAVQSIL